MVTDQPSKLLTPEWFGDAMVKLSGLEDINPNPSLHCSRLDMGKRQSPLSLLLIGWQQLCEPIESPRCYFTLRPSQKSTIISSRQ